MFQKKAGNNTLDSSKLTCSDISSNEFCGSARAIYSYSVHSLTAFVDPCNLYEFDNNAEGILT